MGNKVSGSVLADLQFFSCLDVITDLETVIPKNLSEMRKLNFNKTVARDIRGFGEMGTVKYDSVGQA